MADTAEPVPAAPTTVFKKRAAKNTLRRRPPTPPPATSDDSDSYSSQDESGQRIKRRKTAGIAAGSSATTHRPAGAADDVKATEFEADRTASITATNDATKQSNWYETTADAKDDLSARALLGNTHKKAYNPPPPKESFVARTANAPERKAFGPVKAPTNLRTVTVTDFAPDVCKDYKQTGFCGFGDSCKFLHAREDYKQGWELDREWESVGKKAAGKATTVGSRGGRGGPAGDEQEDEDDAALEAIPFACVICKEPYKSPIVTKCRHYFCERCALQRYRKNPNCAICGGRTDGVFNGARGLKKLLERKRERARKRKEQAREAGEDVSSSDDGDGEGDDKQGSPPN